MKGETWANTKAETDIKQRNTSKGVYTEQIEQISLYVCVSNSWIITKMP